VARVSEHRPSPWIAFAAGAVVMLLLALLWFAWISRADASRTVRAAAEVAADLPELKAPRLPEAPRLPDAPKPVPK
jgi:hypothetical protein